MFRTFVRFGEIDLPQALRRLRKQAALARALLDEFDRVAPASGGAQGEECLGLGTQFAEEFGRLAYEMLECAVATTLDPARRVADNETQDEQMVPLDRCAHT